ncbi:CrcB family protein [Cellulomonas sp. zg-ZUI22]|uniref:CrcB family protein n=1 Tax=Cellulomonas sp. zg-ZUI22 TaxID=2816955 RepID=UPI0027DBE776|nr:CrcB family protein [Cellulomonas sp. zg-ZUI22]
MAAVTPAAPAGVPVPAPPTHAPPTPGAVALVAAGGSVGVLVRAALAQAVPAAPGGWPWTTWAVNVVGSLLLGVLLGVLQRGPDAGRRRAVRLGVGTGVLGGFTTYSTFAVEAQTLVAGGHVVGVAYALVSVVAGVAAAAAGLVLTGRRTRSAGAPAGAPGTGGRGDA